MKRHTIDTPGMHPLLMGGLIFAFVGLVFDFRGLLPGRATHTSYEACQGEVNAQVALSREQLAQLLAIPERDTKERVTAAIGTPYCQLQTLQVRAGVTAERQVYPLAFDPDTRLVVLFEGNEYAGYRFNFQ
ncbi:MULTISPECIES: hypothetical protein [unclassified Leptolyngbya]|uniref:hypothetical protein n=1 Tax=unclassified Leptolyngbya TaxID=2650499 RepID=UPI001684190B|nr:MULTISPECIES: hypothetical protein [unclassified Leptolyngbya]MBD1909549.1 hypothetical protein [Leptolyngbya sp. FACHB-8]MBD2154087.1 hypothetical protein [Leptolyngbya sp. FACHB-16]